MLYDIMTERFNVTCILQKLLVLNKGLFGDLETGSPDNPAIVKQSVHHFFKYVSGAPIKRPAWYIDYRRDIVQNYQPELYVEAAPGTSADELAVSLRKAVAEIQGTYPGLKLEQKSAHRPADWHVVVPDKYRIGLKC